MNFGRFFKLNQNTSDLVEGITNFDYTELPAYDGLASDNSTTPKYPVTMTITDNSIRFKMHYCIYRCSEDRQNGNSDPIYGFSIEDIKHQLYRDNSNDHYDQYSLNIVHIEEVILELPFSGYGVNNLTEIIKQSYIASFPQILEKSSSDANVLTGNRFLDQLIEQVLSNHNLETDAVSYSTLWLMDLHDENGNINLRSLGKDGLIDKFLRKLLLDFMFDLKHSSLFKVSPRYDQMHSGLMNDYYFSALMHKCEYYYYRDLTSQAINAYEKKKRRLKLERKDDKDLESDKERIIHLYAEELFEKEEQWANDIRNPLSEDLFEHNFPFYWIDQKKGRWLSEVRSLIGERMTTTCWDSWFASPEEEMRRIYFPFKTYHNKKDVCNSITINEYFYSAPKMKELYPTVRDSRGKSSRWFLNRYDFNDVLHLHFIKYANSLFLILAIFLFCFLWFSVDIDSLANHLTSIIKAFHNLSFILFILAWALTAFFTTKKDTLYEFLEAKHFHYVFKKLLISILSFTIPIILLFKLIELATIHAERSQAFMLIFLFTITTFIFIVSPHIRVHPVKSGHLFLPKLTASIMAAWLTLSRGFERTLPFFENYFFVIVLLVILWGFIMYQVNKICSKSSTGAKIFKSVEFLIVSYCISLIVGLVMINYMGRDFLEKDGCINEYHITFIENENDKHRSNIIVYYFDSDYQNDSQLEMSKDILLMCTQNNIDTAHIKLLPYKPTKAQNESKYKKLTFIRVPLIGSRRGIIIIPKLWLMSSILAMFIGVFLQIIFFQEKQMTDI